MMWLLVILIVLSSISEGRAGPLVHCHFEEATGVFLLLSPGGATIEAIAGDSTTTVAVNDKFTDIHVGLSWQGGSLLFVRNIDETGDK